MTIIFDGTQGITTPAETANNSVTTPVVKSGSALTLQTNGSTTAVTIDTSQRVGIGTANTLGNSLLNVAEGIVARNSGGTSPYFQLYNGTAGTDLKTWRIGGSPQGNLIIDTVNDAYSVGTERMRIDSSGRVTMQNQPYFHAHNQTGFSSQSFTGDGTVLRFLQIAANRGNGWNSSTFRFTAPITGNYYVYAQVRFDGITDYSRLYIAKNGSTDVWIPGIHNISPIPSVNWSYWSHSVSGVLYLNAGDYIEARGGSNNSSGTHQGESSFGAYLLG